MNFDSRLTGSQAKRIAAKMLKMKMFFMEI